MGRKAKRRRDRETEAGYSFFVELWPCNHPAAYIHPRPVIAQKHLIFRWYAIQPLHFFLHILLLFIVTGSMAYLTLLVGGMAGDDRENNNNGSHYPLLSDPISTHPMSSYPRLAPCFRTLSNPSVACSFFSFLISGLLSHACLLACLFV